MKTGTKTGSQPLCKRAMPLLPELDLRVEQPVTINMALLTELNSHSTAGQNHPQECPNSRAARPHAAGVSN
jgi:hypothetical protein